ncbi:hypothetical protein F5Y18DRAFT_396072 [Xylariaceae sp. FL1019]|nr:hypothetical protein F5Y18DRAFT_396072 [Xylariaceae sp. FL1019]
MPPRPPLFEFGTRTFVCNSCRSTLRKRSAVAPWSIRQSSRVAEALSVSPTKQRRPPEQEADRLKALEALGLLDDSNEVKINFFEQNKDGSIHPLETEEEFGQAFTDPGGQMKAQLDEIDSQLGSFNEFSKFMKTLGRIKKPDDQTDQITGVDDVPEVKEPSSISDLAIPINGLNGNRQDRIHRLNNWIRRCSKLSTKDNILPKDIQGLWKAYAAVRTTMTGRWQTVPLPTWEVLWQVLSADHSFNTSRMSHIYALTKDMQQSGVPLSPQQQLLALEAMFADGWKDEAIENHRRHVSTLGANPETFVQFWELGLQMYCRTGDIERAERVAETIYQSPYEKDPRFVLPLIKLCAGAAETVERGFKQYRNLREALGDSMTIEDYDSVISYFLTSNNTEYALFVFVDMMKSGSIDLVGVQNYPPSVANPFFFGKWLKRLIGAGDYAGAHNVLRFMRDQGIIPRAIQVNGLIGAWLRSGAADDVQKAEEVAWAMINARTQFVELRRRRSDLPGVNFYPTGEAWPRANLETFSLLAENFRERGLGPKMRRLWQAFQAAEIAPDSFMSNQLLMLHLQEGKGELVADLYKEMTKRFNVKPDPHTFTALWQGLAVNRLVKVPSGDLDEEISKTRALFSEMIHSISAFRTTDGLDIDRYLARNILHSFRKLEDRAGLLLSYRALRRAFSYNPQDVVVFELMIGTLDLDRLAKRKDGAKLINVRRALDYYLAHREQELVKSGEIREGKSMPAELRAEETGNFLGHHLEAPFSQMDEEKAQETVREAAEEMGLQKRPAQVSSESSSK